MDVDLELQGVIVTRLQADATVNSLIHGRVYDNVPPSAVFPYVSIGPSDMLDDDADCIPAFQLFLQLDVWSRKVGFPECKAISDAVRNALHDADIELQTNALVFLEHRQTRTLRDPDGLTSHAAITFEASVERK